MKRIFKSLFYVFCLFFIFDMNVFADGEASGTGNTGSAGGSRGVYYSSYGRAYNLTWQSTKEYAEHTETFGLPQ